MLQHVAAIIFVKPMDFNQEKFGTASWRHARYLSAFKLLNYSNCFSSGMISNRQIVDIFGFLLNVISRLILFK